ncbi:hypothetical protein MMC18_000534 [Xylographa bjoerkii]|nr:hypothetical protein [Xylographa bjoerkii]
MKLFTLQIDSSGRYHEIKTAFTGSKNQTGPLVDPCMVAMGMVTSGKHRDYFDTSRSTLLPDCSFEFLDSQINGAAYMLQRTHGTIPVPSAHSNNSVTAAAIRQLKSVKTFGGVIVDEPGFGKTPLALLFASYHALFASHMDETGAASHRPMLLVVLPSAVISPW